MEFLFFEWVPQFQHSLPPGANFFTKFFHRMEAESFPTEISFCFAYIATTLCLDPHFLHPTTQSN